MKKLVAFFMAIVLTFGTVLSAPAQVSAYDIPENMEWWANDKFGMFIHLGAYSSYGQGEWAMYEQKISKEKYQTTIAANFNPVNFDANAVVAAATGAGMKYIVITAKHHEGLSMWDTKVASFKDYTGTKMFSLQQYTPFGVTGRDILMELKNACDAAGIKFGLYYSIIDWNHSSQTIGKTDFTDMASMEARTSYIADMKAQLQELVTKYNPAVMWFDGDWTKLKSNPTLEKWWTKKDGQDLYDYMKQISPDIIVNERVCRGFDIGDFECPEQTIPVYAPDRPWETCQTMNGAWGYKESKENSYLSTKKIVQQLVTVASRDGNYLLNVGPKGDGSMTDGTKKILTDVGKWMAANSDSIYGTTRSPFKNEPSWGLYTRKGKTVYAHVFKWPKKGKLNVNRYKKKKLKSVTLQTTDGKKLKFKIKKNKVALKLPKKAVDKKDTVIVMQYK